MLLIVRRYLCLVPEHEPVFVLNEVAQEETIDFPVEEMRVADPPVVEDQTGETLPEVGVHLLLTDLTSVDDFF